MIKDLGYMGDMGYNQLLYPSHKQTKELLIWLVQRLPRTEGETAEEALGANAILNKQIMESLVKWIDSVRYPHFISRGVPPKNIYNFKPLRTVDVGTQGDVRHVLKGACTAKVSPGATLLERHSYELIADANYATSLENNLFAEGSVDVKAKVNQNVLEALRGVASADAFGATENNKTLVDLLAELSKEGPSGQDDAGRESRFMHATKFTQDQVGQVGGGSPGATSAEKEREKEEARIMLKTRSMT